MWQDHSLLRASIMVDSGDIIQNFERTIGSNQPSVPTRTPENHSTVNIACKSEDEDKPVDAKYNITGRNNYNNPEFHKADSIRKPGINLPQKGKLEFLICRSR